MLNIALLNDQATINNYTIIAAKNYTVGAPLTVKFQISDEQNDIRMIPGPSATMHITVQNSDGSESDIACAILFADDRSMWTCTLTIEQVQVLVSANFIVTLDFLGDGTIIYTGMAVSALAKVTFDGAC